MQLIANFINLLNLCSLVVSTQSFLKISSKFHWTVDPVNLKRLPDHKKIHKTVGGQWLILSYLVRPKKTTKKQN